MDAPHVATKAFPGPALSCHFTVMNFMIYDRRNWILLTFQQFHLSVLQSAPPIVLAFWLPTSRAFRFFPFRFRLHLIGLVWSEMGKTPEFQGGGIPTQ